MPAQWILLEDDVWYCTDVGYDCLYDYVTMKAMWRMTAEVAREGKAFPNDVMLYYQP